MKFMTWSAGLLARGGLGGGLEQVELAVVGAFAT